MGLSVTTTLNQKYFHPVFISQDCWRSESLQFRQLLLFGEECKLQTEVAPFQEEFPERIIVT